MNTNFWNGKKVLLTGHTGFKGSWLSIWLKKLGTNLIGFSKDIPTKPSLFKLARVDEGMISIKNDIRDFDAIKKAIREHQPEIIINMAAQSLVRESYSKPLETFSTNIIGTANLLEAIKSSKKLKVVINVTSDKCYENLGKKHSFVESDPMGGFDPYSSSKGCSELITSAFRNSYYNSKNFEEHGIAIASVRAGNVIGGGDWSKDRLIPDIMRNYNKKAIIIRNPNAIRPWQFVLEPLNGYMLLAEKLWYKGKDFSEAWNFGPEKTDSKSVRYIIENMSKILGNRIKWKMATENNPHEEQILMLDCTKAKKRLNWKSKTSLEQGLKFTVNWYKEYQTGGDMKEFSNKQIKLYETLK